MNCSSQLQIIFDLLSLKYQLDYEDEKVANLKLRKHIAWYIKGLNRASTIKDLINCSKNVKEQLEILKEYEENLIKLNKDVKV